MFVSYKRAGVGMKCRGFQPGSKWAPSSSVSLRSESPFNWIVEAMDSTPETVKEKVYLFGESDFLVADFNPEKFLAKYASSCSLEDLKADIAEFLSRCENAISSIMNTNYDSFISLAMRLNGLKDKLESIQTPLVNNQEQLKIHRDSLLRECKELSEMLARYKEIEEKKYHLQRLLSVSALLEEAEGILADVGKRVSLRI